MVEYIVFLREKYPILFDSMRTFLFFRQMLLDPANLKQDKYGYKIIKSLQLNKKNTVFVDRQEEIKDFFNLENKKLIWIYMKYGLPNTMRFKKNIYSFFENNTGDDKSLEKAYSEAAFFYTLPLMLHYTRFTMILPYMRYILNNLGKPIEEAEVMDYGCGVADIGLLFASLGAKTTITDLNNRKFKFAIWRFHKRGLSPKKIVIKNPSHYPKLSQKKYDLIIATELFEHVRNPLKLLKNFTNAIKIGGFLFDSVGPVFEKDVKGDHLEESIKMGQSKEYRDYYNTHYKQIMLKNNLTCLFQRKI